MSKNQNQAHYLDSVIQELLSPEEADRYYELDQLDERLSKLADHYDPLLEEADGRSKLHNRVQADIARRRKELAALLAREQALRIDIMDRTKYLSRHKVAWAKEADEKNKDRKSQARRDNLSLARAARQAGRLEDAIEEDADVARLLKLGQSPSADKATQERAMVVASASTMVQMGMLSQMQLDACIVNNWSAERLMAASARYIATKKS
jgi:hypothetical protein